MNSYGDQALIAPATLRPVTTAPGNAGGMRRGLFIFLAFTIVYSILIGLALAGVINFYAWGQVTDLHESNATMELLYSHPHFFRYIITYPGLKLSDIYGDVGFSFYIVNFEAVSLFLMYFLLRSRSLGVIVFACLSIAAVYVFMNGRGAISWLGWMVILYIMFDGEWLPRLTKWALLLLALLCCSVSSGTFSVAFSAVLAWQLTSLRPRNAVGTALLVGIIIYAYLGLFLEGLERNLVYYTLGTGNPIVNMLRHGAGALALDHPVLVVLVLIVTMLSALVTWLSLEEKPHKEELISILTPLVGGVFGYTTLTLIIPSIIVVSSRRIGNSRRQQGRPMTE